MALDTSQIDIIFKTQTQELDRALQKIESMKIISRDLSSVKLGFDTGSFRELSSELTGIHAQASALKNIFGTINIGQEARASARGFQQDLRSVNAELKTLLDQQDKIARTRGAAGIAGKQYQSNNTRIDLLQDIKSQIGPGFQSSNALADQYDRVMDQLERRVTQKTEASRQKILSKQRELLNFLSFGFDNSQGNSGTPGPGIDLDQLVRNANARSTQLGLDAIRQKQVTPGTQQLNIDSLKAYLAQESPGAFNEDTIRKFAEQKRQQFLFKSPDSLSSEQIRNQIEELEAEKALNRQSFQASRKSFDSSGVLAALAQREKINTQLTSSRSSLPAFSLSRLSDPETLIQLGFATAFGGAPSVLGALIGGSTRLKGSGALLGSTLAQGLGSALIEHPIDIAKERFAEFKEAGIAYQRSILGISAIEQANNEVVGRDGNPLEIGRQLSFQQNLARNIQLGARRQLLPLGIAGQTESTFVQGITSALAQRGFQASPEQIAAISRNLGGAIVAQRPSLLENTQQLLKDLQDVIGGGPNASRTVLSQLVRPSLAGLKNATSAEDVVNATKSLEAFALAATGLQNPIVSLNKLSGALDNLKTSAGTKALDALAPAFDRLAKAFSDEGVIKGAEGLGTALGSVAGGFVDLQANTLRIVGPMGQFVGLLAKAGPYFESAAIGLAALEGIALAGGNRGIIGGAVDSVPTIITGLPGKLKNLPRGAQGLYTKFLPGLSKITGLGPLAGAVIAGLAVNTGINLAADNIEATGPRVEQEQQEALDLLIGAKQRTLGSSSFQGTLKALGLEEDKAKFDKSIPEDPTLRLDRLRKELSTQSKDSSLEGRGNSGFLRFQIGNELEKESRLNVLRAVGSNTGLAAREIANQQSLVDVPKLIAERQQAVTKAEQDLEFIRGPKGKGISQELNKREQEEAKKNLEEKLKLQTDLNNKQGLTNFGLSISNALDRVLIPVKGSPAGAGTIALHGISEDQSRQQIKVKDEVEAARKRLADSTNEHANIEAGASQQTKEQEAKLRAARDLLTEAFKKGAQAEQDTVEIAKAKRELQKSSIDRRSSEGRQTAAGIDEGGFRSDSQIFLKRFNDAVTEGNEPKKFENLELFKQSRVGQFQARDAGDKEKIQRTLDQLSGVDQGPFAGKRLGLSIRSQANLQALATNDQRISEDRQTQLAGGETGALATRELGILLKQRQELEVEANRLTKERISLEIEEKQSRTELIDGLKVAKEALSDFKEDAGIRKGDSLQGIAGLAKQYQDKFGSLPAGLPSEVYDINKGGLLAEQSERSLLESKLRAASREFKRLPETDLRTERKLENNIESTAIRLEQLHSPLVDFRTSIINVTAALNKLSGSGSTATTSVGVTPAAGVAVAATGVPAFPGPAGVSAGIGGGRGFLLKEGERGHLLQSGGKSGRGHLLKEGGDFEAAPDSAGFKRGGLLNEPDRGITGFSQDSSGRSFYTRKRGALLGKDAPHYFTRGSLLNAKDSAAIEKTEQPEWYGPAGTSDAPIYDDTAGPQNSYAGFVPLTSKDARAYKEIDKASREAFGHGLDGSGSPGLASKPESSFSINGQEVAADAATETLKSAQDQMIGAALASSSLLGPSTAFGDMNKKAGPLTEPIKPAGEKPLTGNGPVTGEDLAKAGGTVTEGEAKSASDLLSNPVTNPPTITTSAEGKDVVEQPKTDDPVSATKDLKDALAGTLKEIATTVKSIKEKMDSSKPDAWKQVITDAAKGALEESFK